MHTPTFAVLLGIGSCKLAQSPGNWQAPPNASPPGEPGPTLPALAPGGHLRDLLHHPLRLRELLEQPVDVGDARPAPLRDALAPGGGDDLRLAALERGHRGDDGVHAHELLLVQLGVVELELAR